MLRVSIKNRSSVPALVLDAAFGDMGEYGQTVGWDLDFRQLDRGALKAGAAVMMGPGLAAIRVRFNRVLHQAGQPPTGAWVFGLPDPSCGDFRWCGGEARGGDLLNFNADGGFDGVSGAGFSGTTLAIPAPVMDRALRVLGLEMDLKRQCRAVSHWRLEGEAPGTLRRSLRRTLGRARRGRTLSPEEVGLFELQTAEFLLRRLAGDELRAARLEQGRRRRIVQSAIDLLASVGAPAPSVATLCESLEVSAPTLYRAFREELGMSPKAYLMAWTLNGIHGDLVRASPTERVNELAAQWGLWHMGQFARDYRKHFGELPSETLRRRVRSHRVS